MNFIKKIFENQIDEKTHNQFTKFGVGTYEYKAILDISVTAKAIKIKTSPEFTNELVELLAQTIKDKTVVKGIIFSTRNLSEESDIEFEDIKNAMGVKKHIINKELTKEQILNICNKFPNASINLSFETDYGSLKTKEKAPKSGKPGKGDEAPKADYCVFTTTDKNILDDYTFDIKKDFKKASINHTFIIEELEVPEEAKTDFAKARLVAKRKGKLIRNLNIDGVSSEKEISFIA